MTGLPYGLIVETTVAVLLVITIGYCIVLNSRLKRLHADRGELRQMVADLMTATDKANMAIQGLKETAGEAEAVITAQLGEAERFAVQLANHVTAGQAVMERIAKITEAARRHDLDPQTHVHNRAAEALRQLRAYQGSKGEAA